MSRQMALAGPVGDTAILTIVIVYNKQFLSSNRTSFRRLLQKYTRNGSYTGHNTNHFNDILQFFHSTADVKPPIYAFNAGTREARAWQF
jgi:hypothetical protein